MVELDKLGHILYDSIIYIVPTIYSVPTNEFSDLLLLLVTGIKKKKNSSNKMLKTEKKALKYIVACIEKYLYIF